MEIDSASGIPPTADYYIEGTLRWLSDADSVQLLGRWDGAGGYYSFGYDPTGPVIYASASGVQIDTIAHDLSISNDALVRLDMTGDQITLSVNGVPNAPVTNATIPGPGLVAIAGGPNRVTSATGVHLRDVTAVG